MINISVFKKMKLKSRWTLFQLSALGFQSRTGVEVSLKFRKFVPYSETRQWAGSFFVSLIRRKLKNCSITLKFDVCSSQNVKKLNVVRYAKICLQAKSVLNFKKVRERWEQRLEFCFQLVPEKQRTCTERRS